jgi:regulator of cell morphogenesis and NO signaling
MMSAVLRAHHDRDPQRLTTLADVLETLFTDLRDHMRQEEDTLFPWARRGAAENAGVTVTALVADHETAAFGLQQIRTLTDGFTPPPDACVTWRALYDGLRAFDRTLREHVHLENNVLFPRALAGEGRAERPLAAAAR